MVKSLRQTGQSVVRYIIIGALITIIVIAIYVFFGEEIRSGMGRTSGNNNAEQDQGTPDSAED